MRETRRISSFTLERYRLGEVSAKERKLIEAELSSDRELRARYKAIDDSDRELRLRYPWAQSSLASLSGVQAMPAAPAAAFSPAAGAGSSAGRLFRVPTASASEAGDRGEKSGGKKILAFRSKAAVRLLCAAAITLCVLFPSLRYMRGRLPSLPSTPGSSGQISLGQEAGGDRVKGTAAGMELSVYIKNAAALSPAPLAARPDEGRKLPDGALLKAGSTVQLAYATPPGSVYYGVIFSIDGRSALTVHYPYRNGESPVLAAGKRTFLGEAYTLDDAPDFEVFFMVVSPEPLDTETVLRGAGELARDPKTAREKVFAVFKDCEVEIVTIRK